MIHLFIDTNEYEKWHFNTKCSIAIFLQKNIILRDLRVYSNNIIIGECLKHINKCNEEIKKTINLINKIEKVELRQMKKNIIEELNSKIKEDFECFLENCHYVNIDLNGIDVEKIASDFFNGNPPFSEKKKEEFPDAIAIESIKLFVEEKNIEKFYIISSDTDWQNAFKNCNNIICCKEWKDFKEEFDKICIELDEGYKNVSNYYNKILDNYYDEIYIEIKELLNNMDFETDYIDGEVYIYEVYIDFPEFSLYDYNNEIVTVSIDYKVDFDIGLSYSDYENAVWDKEDKKYMFLENKKEDRRIETNIEILVDINKIDNSFKIRSVNDSKPIYINNN